MKIPFLVHDLVSARLLLYSSNIHIKHMFIIFMRIQVFCLVFPHILFSMFSLLPDNHTANLGIFLDIYHMCTDLSVRSGDRVAGPGNKLTSSGARMLLNCFKVCQILMGQNRLFFFSEECFWWSNHLLHLLLNLCPRW